MSEKKRKLDEEQEDGEEEFIGPAVPAPVVVPEKKKKSWCLFMQIIIIRFYHFKPGLRFYLYPLETSSECFQHYRSETLA